MDYPPTHIHTPRLQEAFRTTPLPTPHTGGTCCAVPRVTPGSCTETYLPKSKTQIPVQAAAQKAHRKELGVFKWEAKG